MSSDSNNNEGFGHEIYGPGKTFFDDVVMDNLFEAFLELTATVWTYHDRTLVLEGVLQELLAKDKGVNLHELVEQYKPSAEVKAQRKQQRDEMVNRIFEPFARRAK